MKLSDHSVRALQLPPGVADKVYFDSELGGFGIRVREGGSRNWVVQYDLGGKTHKMTLGSTDALTAARHERAPRTFSPKCASDRIRRRNGARPRPRSPSFGALLPRYLGLTRGALRARSYQEVERHLTSHCAALHNRPIAAVDQRAAAILLSDIAAKSGPAAANGVRASGSGFFTWLKREGIVDLNPFTRTNRALTNGARERTPSDAELREIWNATLDDDYGQIVHILMLTGARKSEIANLTWAEVDLSEALITLPPRRVKGGRAHEIPLTPAVLAILKARQRQEGRDFVFGSGQGGLAGQRPKPSWTSGLRRRAWWRQRSARLSGCRNGACTIFAAAWPLR
jgi:hypothetical protein